MGKTLTSKFPNSNTILKNNSKKSRIKRRLTNKLGSEKDLKWKHSHAQENEPPLKKPKTINELDLINVFEEKNEDVAELILKNGNYFYLQEEDSNKSDLFCFDELKTTYLKNIFTDIYWHIFEEIALEGLDGITIEGKCMFLVYQKSSLYLMGFLPYFFCTKIIDHLMCLKFYLISILNL